MEFTFTDYAFSGLLSILAALYGVGYPLIIQSIERINTQYNSLYISDKFLKEPIYSVFRVLLIINMVFAISAPFLLHSGWNNNLFITIQAVLLALLVGQTFLLFRLILLYSSGPKLLRHLESTQIDKHNLFPIFDLAVYADSIHFYSLYYDCMKDVFGYMCAQQGDAKNQSLNIILPPVEYDADTRRIIDSIRTFVKDNDSHYCLSRQNDIVSILFNISSQSRISKQGRLIMWRLVNDAVASNNKTWFSQYWQYADSYENIKYRYLEYSQEELQSDKEMYHTQHVLTGAALIHWGRFDWLNDVFFYTHSEPEYYGLIPSSFPAIILEMRKLANLLDNPFNPWPYYYSDSLIGATDEKRVFRESIRYLSLLVIRLWSLKDRYISDAHVLFMSPGFPVDLEEEKQEIALLEKIKNDLREWERKNVFQLIPNLSQIDIADVVDFVESYRLDCESDLKNKKAHPDVSKRKFDDLLDMMISAVKDTKITIPTMPLVAGGVYKQVATIIEYSKDIETINYSDYIQIGGVEKMGLAEWVNFTSELYRGYCDLFSMIPCLKRIIVCRSQLRGVFNTIGVSSEYVVIMTDTIEECPQKDVVLKTSTRPFKIMVLPMQYLPFVKLEPIRTGGIEPIIDGSVFCTNLKQFISCREPLYNMKIATKMTGCINKDTPGYVQIVIDDFQLDREDTIEISWTLNDLFKH